MVMQIIRVFLVTILPVSLVMADSQRVNTTTSKFLSEPITQDAISSRVYPSDIMMGQYVIWSLKGQSVEQAFEALPEVVLDKVRKHFKIWDVTSDDESIRMVLLPLSLGKVSFPAIDQGRIAMESIDLNIRPNPMVQVAWQLTQPQQVNRYLGQWSSWQTKVTVDNLAFEVRQKIPERLEKTPYQWKARPVPVIETETEIETSKISQFVFSFAPLIDSLEETTLEVPAPIVEVKNHTNRRWLFAHSEIYTPPKLKFQPLPSFLPLEISREKPHIEVSSLPFFATTESLQVLQWRIVSKTGDPLLVPNIQPDLMRAKHKIRWMIPERKQSWFWTTETVMLESTYALPFRPLESGKISLPELRVNYFDSVTGKVKQLVLPKQTQWVFPDWLWTLFTLIGGGVILVSLGYTLKGSVVVWRTNKLNSDFKHQVNVCETPADLRESIVAVLHQAIWVDHSKQMTLLAFFKQKWIGTNLVSEQTIKTLNERVQLWKVYADKGIISHPVDIEWLEQSLESICFAQLTNVIERDNNDLRKQKFENLCHDLRQLLG